MRFENSTYSTSQVPNPLGGFLTIPSPYSYKYKVYRATNISSFYQIITLYYIFLAFCQKKIQNEKRLYWFMFVLYVASTMTNVEILFIRLRQHSAINCIDRSVADCKKKKKVLSNRLCFPLTYND